MPYLRTRQVCEILSISRWTVAELIKAGELTAIKGPAPNSHIKIDKDSVMAYIDRSRIKTDA